MAKGAKKPVAMIDGQNFNGAKAYKDSKVGEREEGMLVGSWC